MSQSFDDSSCVRVQPGEQTLPSGVAMCEMNTVQSFFKPNQDGVEDVYVQAPLAYQDEKFYGNVMLAKKRRPVIAGLAAVTSDQFGIDHSSCLNLGSEFQTLGNPPACAYGPQTVMNFNPNKQ